MNEEQKIETTKHIQTEGGTIYRLSVSGATLFFLELTDDGFGNRYWKQLGTASVNTYPYLLAMFNNLAECPDPSAKSNEPPFRPGDIVRLVGPDWHYLVGEKFEVLTASLGLGSTGWSHDIVDYPMVTNPKRYHHKATDLKLVRRGGE